MTTYVWREGHWVEKAKRTNRTHAVRGDIEPFVSPIDGHVVSGNRQLREHNARNGVTNDLDHMREAGHKEIERSKSIGAPGTQHERKMLIKDAMERVESSGFTRRVQYDE